MEASWQRSHASSHHPRTEIARNKIARNKIARNKIARTEIVRLVAALPRPGTPRLLRSSSCLS